jgi:hypothetical protein
MENNIQNIQKEWINLTLIKRFKYKLDGTLHKARRIVKYSRPKVQIAMKWRKRRARKSR